MEKKLIVVIFLLLGLLVVYLLVRNPPKPPIPDENGEVVKDNGGKKPPKVDKKLSPARSHLLTIFADPSISGYLKDAAVEFNEKNPKVARETALVHIVTITSGKILQLLKEGGKPAVLALSNTLELKQINEKWQEEAGKKLIEDYSSLAVSPLVIATWEPMAQALGWPDKPFGWTGLANLLSDPQGWRAYGRGEWGKVLFSHSHPEYSSSGVLSVLGLSYGILGKSKGLTIEDLDKAETSLVKVEEAVEHYAPTDEELINKMSEAGLPYTHLVTCAESAVVEANVSYPQKQFRIVAIYPPMTFWSDYPYGVVNGDWLTKEQRQIAEEFGKFLLSPDLQAKAMQYGLRPPVGSSILPSYPLDKVNGVDPDISPSKFEDIPPTLAQAAIKDWERAKQKATVVLVVDTSGSMKDSMKQLREALARFIASMDDGDKIEIVVFNDKVQPLNGGKVVELKEYRESLEMRVRGLYAMNETALRDAIIESLEVINKAREGETEKRRYAIVLLSDGVDNRSESSEEELIRKLPSSNDIKEGRYVSIFAIAYGSKADTETLYKLAQATNGRMFLVGDPSALADIYDMIAANY